MFKVTADVFSGRPNPEWTVDGDEAKAVLKELALSSGAVAEMDSGFQGLGNRGLIVEPLSDAVAGQYNLPSSFRIGNGAGANQSKGLEVAERLIKGMLKATPSMSAYSDNAEKLDKQLQKLLLDQLGSAPEGIITEGTAGAEATTMEATTEDAGSGSSKKKKEKEVDTQAICYIEMGAFNPAFWNASAVIGRNNCYNYASNRRTDTFAQPGRATGQMYAALTCAQVGPAAVRDGARQDPNCAPATESPRWYMALVMAPGYDYHWYRKSIEGFWGHKPGGTAARNTDNSGRIIYDPRTANRGPYTIFCGFFFAQRRMVVR
jgi:hypothetical protein